MRLKLSTFDFFANTVLETVNGLMELIKAALFSGRFTHSHPVSDAVSIAGAYAVKLALDGINPEEMFESLHGVTEEISQEFTDTLKNSYQIAYLGWEMKKL